MALLAATARRASALLRPTAAAAPLSSMRRRSSSSSIRFLCAKADSYRAEAASYRAQAATFRDKADSIHAATHDGELLRVIDSVIHSHNGDVADEISSEFPFEISKIEGFAVTNVTLKRCLKGELIEVLVSIPRFDQDEEDDDDLQEPSNSSSSSHQASSSSSDSETTSSSDSETSSSSDSETTSSSDNESSSSSDELSSSSEDQGENHPEEYDISLTVTVSKPDGSSLEFDCIAYPDESHEITIETVCVRPHPPSGAEQDDDAYEEGPDFSDLDKNLQEGLHKYLEVRGITPINTKLLHDYIITKEQQRYQLWLKKLGGFVRKD